MTSPDPLFSRKTECGYSAIDLAGSVDPDSCFFSRPSIVKRESFISQFRTTNGAPQVVAVVFMLAMAMGSIIGIIPSIMTERYAVLRYNYDGDDCNNYTSYDEKPQECIDASADAQNAAAISELVANILTLVSSSWLGSITDVHGRRGMFIVAASLAAFGPFALFFTVLFDSTSPLLYYSARTLHGLVNFMAIALSSLADVLPKHLRAPGVGILMAGFWLGICIGPMIAVFFNHFQVAALSCAINAGAVVVALIFSPETVPPHIAEEARIRQEQKTADRSRTGQLLWNLMRPIRELSIINRNSFFRLLSLLAFFNGMVTAGDKTLLIYYVDSKLSFSPKEVAIMFLLVGICSVVAQAVILKPLNDCIGERLIVVICFFASTLANIIYGLSQNRETMYAGVCLGAMSGMAFPTIAAIKANNVHESEQGRIQGALYSIQAVAAGVGPMMMRCIDHFAKETTSLGPGSMFFFAALLQIFAFCFACMLPKDKSNSRNLNDVLDLTDKSQEEMSEL